ncbi:uncharacterized protein YyaL (SSP411 family) [Halarchaeum rubridurum]|uniref:Uncharacterized protein YyaL (SSP411 family) n=1 Tax=Halarchaeum rubridurum TaxID=489911 RepID=A0A830FSZ3_9EURY|nr:DUF255 domain-containing protein [Halarchaeum rubridurum]MBP1954008.1 uncharacterized protein YyaL (SSP411 family) [Halarchaeum rubridurum]GGM56612.1 hypothetical protein GCM10009017_03460 [Halarchaeum rubridurum]
MDESAERTKVEWRPWGPAAFDEAAESGTPVLLSLVASWSARCREMDRGAFSVPTVAANVNEEFVPVRADADRHPRVRERYNMGGFPSTVFLTPSGDLIAGATYLEAESLRGVLDRVRETWDEKGEEAGRVPRALRGQEPPAGPVTDEIEALVAGQLGEQYDDRFGGWATNEKFPLPRTIDFALKRERQQALRTLEAVSRNLADDYDGGFYRFAHARDWSDPQREKLLSTNAGLLRAFANAYLYTGRETYEGPASNAVDYLTSTLWTGEAFAGSQHPGDYFERPPSERAADDEPGVDATAYAGNNARAADALLTYYAYTDDRTAERYAERTLDYLAETLVADGVVARYDDPDAPRGILTDHAALTVAFARGAQTVDPDYLDVATAVADHAVETLQDAAFRDGPEEAVGLLDKPLHPIDDNATMAHGLLDLAALTDDDAYRAAARDAIGAFAGAADRMGVQVADYAAAASRAVERPLTVRVGDAPGTDLHRAALRVADHEKVVVPDADGVEDGAAFVAIGGDLHGPATDPEELTALVAEHV